MRTIDFRGKAVGSGRWVHGDLVWMGRQPAIFEYADFENGCVTIQEKTLGMNTGLRDKNNHEIYGGDILAHNGRVIGHVVDGVRGYCFDVVCAIPNAGLTCSTSYVGEVFAATPRSGAYTSPTMRIQSTTHKYRGCAGSFTSTFNSSSHDGLNVPLNLKPSFINNPISLHYD